MGKVDRIVVLLLTAAVGLAGSVLTKVGLPWYRTLVLPPWVPRDWIFSLMWTAIYVCAALSVIIVWEVGKRRKKFLQILALFAMNAGLNVLWTALFFQWHLLAWSAAIVLLLELTVFILIIWVRPISRVAAYLLLPYLVWVAFASVVALEIWRLNA